MFTSIKDTFWGRSNKHIQEDDVRKEAFKDRTHDQRQRAHLAIRKQYEDQRRRVSDQLEQARDRERQAKQNLDAVWSSLANSQLELEKADSDIAQTKIDLGSLEAKTMELVRYSSASSSSSCSLHF